jgi:hypothetical protein
MKEEISEEYVENLLTKNANLRIQLAAAQAASDKRDEIAQEYYLCICNLEGELAATQLERNAAQAEVERLRKSLALVDDALNSYAEFYGRAAGLAGLSDDALPSTTTDEIILRKIAEHDEVERLRGIIREAIGYCSGSRVAHIGEFKAYVPQIDVEAVKRWRETVEGGAQ